MKISKVEMIIFAFIIGFLCGICAAEKKYGSRGAAKEVTTPVMDEGMDTKAAGELEAPVVYITMEVTAYCSCSKCCGSWADGHFANGEEVSFPAIASDSMLPFGTRIYVPGYGVASVKDRGGAIKGNKLDLYFPSHQAALEWGRQTLDVEVLK